MGPLLVFDLDGTLTDTNAVDGGCYLAAVDAAYGPIRHRERASDYRHVTDEGILAETLRDNELIWRDATVAALKEDFVARMAAVFDAAPPEPLAGVSSFLAWLRSKEVPWCVATGAWFASARLKLDRAGLALDDAAVIACDGVPAKRDILSAALAVAMDRHGPGVADRPPIYLGDRPYDLRAARELRWDFIGVGDRVREAAEADGRMWIRDFALGRVGLEQRLHPRGDPLGLARAELRLVDHDRRWAGVFSAEAERLRGACGTTLVDVQHFGSTAIPGIRAKPMVDILAAIPSMADAETLQGVLAELGYEHRPDAGHERRAVFVYGSPSRFHLHLTTVDAPVWRGNLHFRDRLLADPALAREYERVKRRCLREHADDRPAYTEAKGAFIRPIKEEV